MALYYMELDVIFDDILSMIEELVCLEELNVYHTHCPYRNPDYGYPIPISMQKIQNAVQKCNRPKLVIFLPWIITSSLFDKTGEILEEVLN